MSSPVRRSWPRSISWWVRPRPGWRWCGRRRSPTATDGVTVSEDEEASGRYIVVKALEDGVVIMGLTRGKDTRSHHSERLDAGEVLVAQFTELTAAIKIRGKAEIMTDVGKVESGG
ncbi:MAG: trp RNA-binding attenuation protein MtrB [Chloroflexi bacterium]|nr:MAG: trp RNA-binding attenuation protein MtrB [Chloroflexota bacterium]